MTVHDQSCYFSWTDLKRPSIDYWSTIIEPSLWYASRSHWFCCCLLVADWRQFVWRMKWCSCFFVSHGMFKICLHDLANGCDFENLCTRAASGVDGAAILLNKFTCTLWRCTLRNMPKFVFDTSFLTFGLQICALCWHVELLPPCKLLNYNVEFNVNLKSASCFTSTYFVEHIPRVMLSGRMCKVSVFHDMCMLSWWVGQRMLVVACCA